MQRMRRDGWRVDEPLVGHQRRAGARRSRTCRTGFVGGDRRLLRGRRAPRGSTAPRAAAGRPGGRAASRGQVRSSTRAGRAGRRPRSRASRSGTTEGSTRRTEPRECDRPRRWRRRCRGCRIRPRSSLPARARASPGFSTHSATRMPGARPSPGAVDRGCTNNDSRRRQPAAAARRDVRSRLRSAAVKSVGSHASGSSGAFPDTSTNRLPAPSVIRRLPQSLRGSTQPGLSPLRMGKSPAAVGPGAFEDHTSDREVREADPHRLGHRELTRPAGSARRDDLVQRRRAAAVQLGRQPFGCPRAVGDHQVAPHDDVGSDLRALGVMAPMAFTRGCRSADPPSGGTAPRRVAVVTMSALGRPPRRMRPSRTSNGQPA